MRVAGETASKDREAEEGIKRCPTRVYAPFGEGPGTLYLSGATSYGYNRVGYVGKAQNLDLSLGLSALREADVRVPSDMIALGDNFALLNGKTVVEFNGLLGSEEVTTFNPPSDRVERASERHRTRALLSSVMATLRR